MKAAERGYVDDIIMPDQTRKRIIDDLNILENKKPDTTKRKHSNLPL